MCLWSIFKTICINCRWHKFSLSLLRLVLSKHFQMSLTLKLESVSMIRGAFLLSVKWAHSQYINPIWTIHKIRCFKLCGRLLIYVQLFWINWLSIQPNWIVMQTKCKNNNNNNNYTNKYRLQNWFQSRCLFCKIVYDWFSIFSKCCQSR